MSLFVVQNHQEHELTAVDFLDPPNDLQLEEKNVKILHTSSSVRPRWEMRCDVGTTYTSSAGKLLRMEGCSWLLQEKLERKPYQMKRIQKQNINMQGELTKATVLWYAGELTWC